MDEKGQRAQFMRRQTTKKKEIKNILYNKLYKNVVLLVYYMYKTCVISMKSFEIGILFEVYNRIGSFLHD